MRTEFCDARAIGKASRSSQPLKRCARTGWAFTSGWRSEEHTSELQSRSDLVCRLLLEKKRKHTCSQISARLGMIVSWHRNPVGANSCWERVTITLRRGILTRVFSAMTCALLVGGCSAVKLTEPTREEVLQKILPSAVQVVVEQREGRR